MRMRTSLKYCHRTLGGSIHDEYELRLISTDCSFWGKRYSGEAEAAFIGIHWHRSSRGGSRRNSSGISSTILCLCTPVCLPGHGAMAVRRYNSGVHALLTK